MSEDLVAPVAVDEPSVVAAAADPATVPPPAEEVDDVIEIPTGEKLVPLSALTSTREKLKAAKDEAAQSKALADQAAAIQAERDRLAQEREALLPKAQAYDAAIAAQNRPAQPTGPTAEETAFLEEYARDLDLYTADGKPDVTRAEKILGKQQALAEKAAAARVAPIEARNTADRSHVNLERALITKGTDGSQPDPEILRAVFARLDPALTATPEGAIQAWTVAMGYSQATGKLVRPSAAPKPAEPLPDPLLTERAGGRDIAAGPVLTERDRRVARDLGMTEKEYEAELKKMPAGWGKS